MPLPLITVAPNGARRLRSDHPALPVTTDQVAETARACQLAGAQALHLHVRDDTGRHSLDPGRYRETIAAVETAAPGMAIQITTESGGIFQVGEQYQTLEALRPAAASISVREMARDPEIAARVYALCSEVGTEVQHILYGLDCIKTLLDWRHSGVINPGQNQVIFVLGQYNPPVLARPEGLLPFLNGTKGANLDWTVCAFGRYEHTCLLEALKHGGAVRIGFENNTETPNGEVFADNAASVAAFVRAAETAGHTLNEVA
ncbi:3-keto-5-aminohexanoate cleavage protein [Phaeobacter gallaeciensis]|uniref:3-keto-5-aminohexanoate cleavage protein n=2 Tax=Roseobacteraceae TaxID=2854170 RepID=A0A366X6H0_9RHOB|nr:MULTISPECIES: 3-keto-5-aminohexanoate cleavage protein [Roseobacteraceae]MBT3142524.1 3-keto-5-aminohexanoate cleavage protein [Falsiruegeria litorea]MBT8169248.1 3-keto-5-aminohexanoate cleavage protein [Falsiruegeria litorea]RBW60487.1 3-keto-5-aminohexanoate cleavage protein [Phaeobacter gallaeciensis]